MFINNRHSIRLRGYDYSSDGWYFVTICIQNKECLLGQIVGAGSSRPSMSLNESGCMVESIWYQLPARFSLELDEIQIMPNHVHMIICIVGAHHDAPKQTKRIDSGVDVSVGREDRAPTLGQIVAYFKYQSNKAINAVGAGSSRPREPYFKIWQRNYYEHIIRNEKELNQIRQYIRDNPTNWEKDDEYPAP